MDRGQKLSRVVVQGVGDPAGLLLEPLVQPAQRLDRLLEAAVGHLDRRQALRQEPQRGVHGGAERLGRPALAQDRLQGFLVQRDQVQDPDVVADGPAPQLVGPLQRGFPAVRQVVP